MGNVDGVLCCADQIPQRNTVLDSMRIKILTINQEFLLKQIRESQGKVSVAKTFEEYHNKILFDLIYHGENLQPRPESFIDTNQQVYRQAKSKLYIAIRDDIVKHPKCLFNLVLRSYFDFICKIFNISPIQVKQENDTSTEGLSQYQELSVTFNKINFSSQSIKFSSAFQEQEHLANLNRKNLSQLETSSLYSSVDRAFLTKELSSLTLNQINVMAIILRFLFMFTYQDIINRFFKGHQQSFTERELFIQKIIQHFFLGTCSPLKCFMHVILEVHYEADFQKQAPQEEPKLDVSLMPKQRISSLYESNLFDEDSIMGTSAMSSMVNEQTNYIQQMIEKTSQKYDKEQIPYYQTFPVIIRLIQTQKPWKKFKLIENLVKKITQIFLRERSMSQFNQLVEVISAEDSKSEIMLFIIYKFSQAYPYIDLKRLLLYPLRFMSDFDGFLHQDIKYIHCTSFIRFYSVLELMIVYYIFN